MEETLRGQVVAVIFKNDDTGYTVAKIRDENDDTVTAVGNMPGLTAGEYLEAFGEYVEHSQYGRQFSVRSFERTMPTDASSMFEYLASGAVRGIGVKTAQTIVEKFGDEAFYIIANEPKTLAKIRGISYERALSMQKSFLQAGVMRGVLEFLQKNKLPVHFAPPLVKKYGGDAVEILKNDPYILCNEPFVLPFREADRLAFDLNIDGESAVRQNAALLFELFFNLQNGHVFLPDDKLVSAAENLCGVSEDKLYQALDRLVATGKIVRGRVGKVTACYLSRVYRYEKTAAEQVKRLTQMRVSVPHDLEKTLVKQEKKAGVCYAEGQKQAILSCFYSGISIITGGPGTGKTTALLTLIDMLSSYGYTFELAAPTGRAADRMEKITSCEARTLHRLLETVPDESGEMVFRKNNANPIDADFVIIDEASMLDLYMSASLLDALKPGARLVLVGDADQLPPVGAGRFFADLLESGTVPAVRLTEIFRQAQKSMIIMNAHRVNRGEMPEYTNKSGDFYFQSCRTAQATANAVAELCAERIPSHFEIEPSEIQVICPSRRNVCGTEELNRLLQQKLNPPDENMAELPFGSVVFREGDRVMQIKNNYDRVFLDEKTRQEGAGVYNGDTGVIEHIDSRGRIMRVRFGDKTTVYQGNDLQELEHAFAVTAHKSQGSEYRAVIIPIFDCPQRLLLRNLLYTAVTRAKELLVICGREDIMEQMVVHGGKIPCYSALKRRLRGEDDEI